MLQSMTNSDSNASSLSLNIELSIRYVTTALGVLLLPFISAPFFLPDYMRMTEGHWFFQYSVYAMLACVPVMGVVLCVTQAPPALFDAVALPSELVFAFATYVLVALCNATKYAFVEVKRPPQTDGEQHFLVDGKLVASEVESTIEYEHVEQLLEGLLPPENENPVRSSYDHDLTGKQRTTKRMFLRRWLARSMLVAAPYLLLGPLYRCLVLPYHAPVHAKDLHTVVVSFANATGPMQPLQSSASSSAVSNTMHTLAGWMASVWAVSAVDNGSSLSSSPLYCEQTIRNAWPFGLGGYRLHCAPLVASVPLVGGTLRYTIFTRSLGLDNRH